MIPQIDKQSGSPVAIATHSKNINKTPPAQTRHLTGRTPHSLVDEEWPVLKRNSSTLVKKKEIQSKRQKTGNPTEK